MTTPFDIQIVRSERQWKDARTIRELVFVIEQNCPPAEEWDAYDDTSRHLVGYADGLPVATARWRATAHHNRIVAKLERFAVLKEYRGAGYGRQMVRAALEDAQEAGFKDFLLHAQEHLVDFYGGFGFRTSGDRFLEAGIPHVMMERIDESAR